MFPIRGATPSCPSNFFQLKIYKTYMNIQKNRLYLLLGIVILIASCNGAATSETESNVSTKTNTPVITDSDPGYPSPPTEPTVESGYPIPVQIPTVAGYPEPNSDQSGELYATPGPIPQASSSSGVVVGTIQVNNEPIPNLTIYLAEVLIDGEDQERVASYDRVNSPRAFTDEEGQFVFADINPGKYGLVLDTVLSSYLLHLPQEEIPLVISVEAGEQTSVELLNYDFLPLPQSDE